MILVQVLMESSFEHSHHNNTRLAFWLRRFLIRQPLLLRMRHQQNWPLADSKPATRGQNRSVSLFQSEQLENLDHFETVSRDRECPLWVKSGSRGKSASCPLFPSKQAFASAVGMSVKGHQQTFGLSD